MDGDVELPDLELANEPLVIVVGSEGKGLSRLVRETCDQIVSVPMSLGGRVAQRRHRHRGHPLRSGPSATSSLIRGRDTDRRDATLARESCRSVPRVTCATIAPVGNPTRGLRP